MRVIKESVKMGKRGEDLEKVWIWGEWRGVEMGGGGGGGGEEMGKAGREGRHGDLEDSLGYRG